VKPARRPGGGQGAARNAPDARQDVNVHRRAAARPCRQERAVAANRGKPGQRERRGWSSGGPGIDRECHARIVLPHASDHQIQVHQ